MDGHLEKIASILRVAKNDLEHFETDMEKITGRTNVLQQIVDENDSIVRKGLDALGLGRNVSAFEVYDALISKVEADDLKIFEALGRPDLTKSEGVSRVLELAKNVCDGRKGFFLKKEVAEGLLRAEPPMNTLKALGYKNVDEMFAKEDLFEIFSSLRFLEDPTWLNTVFFKQYSKLTAADFEERGIIAKALDVKWVNAAEKFVKKKYHNVSHLKELGVIFVIPISLGVSGEILRLVSLLCHYCHEIFFYSNLIKKFSEDESTFSKNLVSLLRGDVIEERLPGDPSKTRPKFLIIQRYLGKDDENDWRLFVPHINPEAEHWRKATGVIARLGEALPKVRDGFNFWKDLDWVGEFFKDNIGKDILVSFNLVDTVMSLVKEKEMIKYLYHHQEALWNKIFTEYFSEEYMAEKVKENIIKGWFEV